MKKDAVPTIFGNLPHIEERSPRPTTSLTCEGQHSPSVIAHSSTQRPFEPPLQDEEISNWLEPDVDLDQESNTSDYSVPSITQQLVCIRTPTDDNHNATNNTPKSVSIQTEITLEDMRFFDSMVSQNVKLKKNLQAERMKAYRLRRKMKKVSDLFEDLTKRSLISTDFVGQLKEACGDNVFAIVENEMHNRTRQTAIRYPSNIKQFAMTVHVRVYSYTSIHLLHTDI